MPDPASMLGTRVQEAAQTISLLGTPGLLADLTRAARLVTSAVSSDRCVFVFGNGGSAADAAHLAAEFVGRCTVERRALPAVALSESGPTVSALANDYGFDRVFARQLEALGKPGDVAIGMSTSGRSPNVLAGLKTAREKGLVTIGMTGIGGVTMGDLVDCLLVAPSRDTPRIQECHHLWSHLIAEFVDVESGHPDRG